MVNNLVFQGRLVRDIELSHTRSDVAYTEFTIAWSEKYKEMETKCFLRCKAWRNTAEFLSKYFQKGSMLAIDGHLITEEWETNGEKKSRTICQVDKVHFCGGNSTGNNSGGNDHTPENRPKPMDDGFMDIPDGIDEELPFN